MKMKLLIVEDDPGWVELLQNEFIAQCEETSVSLEYEITDTEFGANALISLKMFQAMSIDQNIPDRTGSQATASHGQRFAKHVARSGVPVFASIYTRYGDETIANALGRETGFDYKLKGVKTNSSELEYEPDDYVTWFLAKFKNEYVRSVLKQVTLCGHADLAEQANLALRDYDGAFIQRNETSMDTFFTRLSLLREKLTHHLVALTSGITQYESIRAPEIDSRLTASDAEKWLYTMWQKNLGRTQSIEVIQSYLSTPPGKLYPTYINAFSELRMMRNRIAHGDIHHITKEDFERLMPAIFSFADMLNYFASRPMVFRPRAERQGIVSYTELNRSYYEPREMRYERDIPADGFDDNTIYTQLAPDQPLIPISPAFQAARARNNRFFVERTA